MAAKPHPHGFLRRLRPLVAMAVLDLLPACTRLSAQDDLPAVIAEAGAASRAELARVVSEALDGAPVMLAEDALVHADRLVIERARSRDPAGRTLDGRIVEPPERFRLVRSGAQCVLIRERDGARFALRGIRCVRVTDR
jgi:hypothetical protein